MTKRAVTEQDLTPWPEDLRQAYLDAGYWQQKPLTDILDERCAKTPDKGALICKDHRFSFAELNRAAEGLAQHLQTLGVAPGDHAVVQLPNTSVFYVTYWALLKLRVKPAFALFHHGSYELRSFVDQLRPRLFIGSRTHKLFAPDSSESSPLAKDLLGALGNARVLFHGEGESNEIPVEWGASDPPRFKAPELDPEDIAFFQLSGGSTSRPKLIPRTHNDYHYSIRQSAKVCQLTESTVYLCALPAPHNFPMSSPGALGVWYAGGSVVMAPDPSPGTCFPMIKEHQVTMTSLVPSMVNLWLKAEASGSPAEGSLDSLKVVQVGGANLPEQVAKAIEPTLGCRLQQVFGMAEGLVCYTRLDDDDWHRHHTQGLPMSEADELKIVDEAGNEVLPGKTGQLCTRGPYTIRGYFRSPEHNQTAFDREGFYKTGDLVKRTPSGHVMVVGRIKDQINRGGEKIAAEEIENLLLRMDGIQQAAVTSIPDAGLGEKICAFLVCDRQAPKPHEIRRHLRALGIADYKLPDRFVPVAGIPLTAVGKPDKKKLRQEARK